MRSKVLPLAFAIASFFVLASRQAHAQSLYSGMLDRFDANKDGKIKRSEVPEAYRGMFDRIWTQFKLDPERTYDRKELEKILGVTNSTPSSTPGPSSSTGGSSGRSRGGPGSSRSFGPTGGPSGGSRSFGSRTNGSRPGESSSSSSNGARSVRTLGELPPEYRALDKDGDGQIGLYEWPKNDIATFLRLDLNDDGFVTASELKKPTPKSDSREVESSKDSKSGDDPPSDEKPPTNSIP